MTTAITTVCENQRLYDSAKLLQISAIFAQTGAFNNTYFI